MSEINQLTGNKERLSDPDLTVEQYDALLVLLDGKSYSEHIQFNGREYFKDDGLWVVAYRSAHHEVAFRGAHHESGNQLNRELIAK